ncbi:hypothetical protein WH50_24635, partial [Pokkaliibacter plantistimulans]
RLLKNVLEAAEARKDPEGTRNKRKAEFSELNMHLTHFARPFGAVLKQVQPLVMSLFLTRHSAT